MITKKPKSELFLRPTEPTPKPVYEPPKQVIEKKEKKSELFEICKLTLRKSDIVMLTVVKNGIKKAFAPILIDPSTLEMSFKVEKQKKLPAIISAFSSIKGYKHSGVNKIPINLQLDPKVLSKLPKLSNEDYVILTIIRASNKKKPAKVVSHFVDKIGAAPIKQSY